MGGRRMPGGHMARGRVSSRRRKPAHADAKRGKEAVSGKEASRARKPCPSRAWKGVRDALCVARQREACADWGEKLACRAAG
jgi:hypothetical protein